MLFNSYEYIFLFLPLVAIIYLWLRARGSSSGAKIFLALASIFFYGWWAPQYTLLLLLSIGVNYILSRIILSSSGTSALVVGICFNLSLLGYYKYTNFMISNLNLIGLPMEPLNILLPLGISFFTFQQIAFLVDTRKGKVAEHSFLDYSVFVSFFPQLVAGPIVHHSEVMPQFQSLNKQSLDFRNIFAGLHLLAVGLVKKVVIADRVAIFATQGFDIKDKITFIEAWLSTIAYTLQIYFDFSGYADMAIGAALMINIRLPLNFNSPYKALNLQDFWRRWHITLSRFLRDYIYIPLGGNRHGERRTNFNLLAVFLIGGLWHGAAWTFVAWGALHGLAQVAQRVWTRLGFSMPRPLAWACTFLFLNITWVFFRATNWGDAWKILHGLVDVGNLGGTGIVIKDIGIFEFSISTTLLVLGLGIALLGQNKNRIIQQIAPTPLYRWSTAALLALGVVNLGGYSEFLYFNF